MIVRTIAAFFAATVAAAPFAAAQTETYEVGRG